MEMADLKLGRRVEVGPWTDLWMRGLRYGRVEHIGRKRVGVRFDRDGHQRLLRPDSITRVLPPSTPE